MREQVIAAILGVVEGFTEFLPVSSTGHLILASHALGFDGPIAGSFNVFIQLGAILAVVVLYRARFLRLIRPVAGGGFQGWKGIGLLALTTLPALVFGKLAHDWIKDVLFNPAMVAVGLIAGSIWILATERLRRRDGSRELDDLNWRIALAIGLIQCAALWPGVSRSAATILGGMLLGLHRKAATEYSFFAAVPVLGAAAMYEIAVSWPILTPAAVPYFTTGFVVSFVFAWLAIRFLIRFVSHNPLSFFAWYRFGLAALVFWLLR
jgi:undecaprenyl-diphosphatase